jgi:hypothetical protein
MVKHNPSMVVLGYVGSFPFIKPLDSMGQGYHCGKRTGRH